MKTNTGQRRMRGLTLIEVIAIFVGLLLLAVVALILFSSPRSKAQRIQCFNQLRSIGLGLRLFANDNGDALPSGPLTNRSGVQALVSGAEAFRFFQAATDEIGNPRILLCPADKDRAAAPNMASLKNNNLSYFVNLAVTNLGTPALVFLGDRNLVMNGKPLTTGNYLISTQQVLKWGPQLHKFQGNLALSDGSVRQTDDARLNAAFTNGGLATNHLAVP